MRKKENKKKKQPKERRWWCEYLALSLVNQNRVCSESEVLGSAFYQVSSCVSFAYQGLRTCKDLGRIE